MKDAPNKKKTISIIYLICAVICTLRGALNLYSGNLPVGMVQIVLAAVCFTMFSIYKNPPEEK